MATRRNQQTTEEEEPGGLTVETLDRGTEHEDDDTTQPPNGQQPRTVKAGENLFTEDEVNKRLEAARQQEKDKLYSRLEQQDTVLADLKADLEARRQAEADRLKAEQEAQAAKDREELSAKDLLDQRESEWERRFQELQQGLQQRDAIIQREAQFQELQATRARLLQEADAENTIAPQLLDYVGGSSEDEIRQSIAMAQSKSTDIVQEFKSRQTQVRREAKGASVTQPPVGPMETDQAYETLTPDDINNMSMADYARNRQKLLQAASRARFGAQ